MKGASTVKVSLYEITYSVSNDATISIYTDEAVHSKDKSIILERSVFNDTSINVVAASIFQNRMFNIISSKFYYNRKSNLVNQFAEYMINVPVGFNFNISDSLFQGSGKDSDNVGAIQATHVNAFSLEIYQSTFRNLFSKVGGASLSLAGYSDITISNTRF